MKFERWPGKRRVGAHRLLGLLLCVPILVSLGFYTSELRFDSRAGRTVGFKPMGIRAAFDETRDEPHRIQGVVDSQREAREIIAGLRALESGGGALAEHARNALASIRDAAK